MQANILITGFVQGVGFRQFVKRKAKELSLTGWVRNLPDGSVEAIVSGAENNIKLLINYCKKGPFMSEVENLQISWEENGEKFEEFIIRVN